MNKTFNINLGGYPFAIDEDAYNYIQNYLNTIRKHFSASDGCEEILYDIEVRMAELFQEHLKGRAIISMKEIDEVIMIMGKPEDFGAEPMAETHYSSSRNKKFDGRINTGKRLFRDPDDKKLAGVCSGIAAYFGVSDPLWIRLVFALFFFFGFGVMAYFVLWALVPEASNAGDKLAMRGEPATIENIAKIVEEELTEFGEKINEWSKDLGTKKKSESVNSNSQAKSFLVGGVNLFGKIVSGIIPTCRNILKPMLVFIAIVTLSILGISWAASFIGLTFVSPLLAAMGPKSGLLSYLGIGSLFFTIGLPILGMMLFISRLTFGYKIHKNVKTGFWTLWFLSIFVSSFAGMSTVKEYSNIYESKTITNYQIDDNEINITMPEENIDHSFGIHLGQFFTEKDNNWAFRDVTIKIEKSADDKVHIEKQIASRGQNSDIAQKNAEKIDNDLQINGNKISISKYLTFPKSQKFRDQSLDYILYIPEGKTITFDENTKERMKQSSILSIDQIYGNVNGMKWLIRGDAAFSNEWKALHHHIRDISPGQYSKIIIENGFDVIITKSDISSIQIEGNKELVEKVFYKNLDGTLLINSENDNKMDGITINIKTPNLEVIHFDGIKSAKIDGFSQESLKLISKDPNNMFQNTNIVFFGSVNNFNIILDGDQLLTLNGSGNLLELNLTDGAVVKADKYTVKHAIWQGDQSYRSKLNVTDSLSCSNPENIHLDLTGNPKIVKI